MAEQVDNRTRCPICKSYSITVTHFPKTKVSPEQDRIKCYDCKTLIAVNQIGDRRPIDSEGKYIEEIK
jgi:hypothetical protein